MGHDAFISYSHAADGELAPAVQEGLQRLAKPWNRRRSLEVFRDQTGLSVSPHLWHSIVLALDGAEHFVLLASPESAASAWVNQEIEHWTATHSTERILPVVTGGEWSWDTKARDFDWELSTAVPRALAGVFVDEPRHLDLRWARSESDLDLRNPRFKEAIAELAAPMHGVSKDDLVSEDVMLHRRAGRVRRAAVAAFTVLLVLLAGSGAVALENARSATASAQRALEQRRLADEQRAAAETAAAEALRQQGIAEVEEGKAHAAAQESLRQQGIAEMEQARSAAAAREALRQQGVAQVEQGRAAAAAAEARAQQGFAEAERGRAESAAAEADRQRTGADRQRRLAEAAATAARAAAATARAAEAETGRQRDEARRQQQTAEGQTRLALAGQLAGQASEVGPEDLAGGLLLAVQATRFSPSVEARSALLSGLQRYAGVTAITETAAGHFRSFSSDGSVAVAITPAGQIQLWDAVAGEPLGVAVSADRLGADPGDPRLDALAIAASSSGVLVSGGFEGPLRFLDTMGDPAAEPVMRSGLPGVFAVEVSPDGRWSASSHLDGSVRVWDLRTATVRSVLARPCCSLVREMAFSPDGETLAIPVDRTDLGLEDTEIQLWDATSGQDLGRRLLVPGTTVLDLVFGPDGVLASVDDRGVARLWDTERARLLGRLVDPQDPTPVTVHSLAFGADGMLASVGSGSSLGGSLRLWNASTLEPASRSIPSRLFVGHLSLPRPGLMVTAGAEGRLHSWDVAGFGQDGRVLATRENDGLGRQPLAVGPDGLIAAARPGGVIQLLDAGSERLLSELVLPGGSEVLDVAVGPRGLVASSGADAVIRYWDAGTGREIARTTLPAAEPAVRLAVSVDGRTVASTGAQRTAGSGELLPHPIRLWDSLTGGAVGRPLTGPMGEQTLRWGARGQLAAEGEADGLWLWEPRTSGHPEGAHTSTLASRGFDFSPSGDTVVTLDLGGQSLRMWDVGPGAGPGVPIDLDFANSLDASFTSVDFAPDGATVAAGGYNHNGVSWGGSVVHLWDVAHGQPVGGPWKDDDRGADVMITGDGQKLVKSHARGIRVYDLALSAWQRQACSLVARDLTATEWAMRVGEDIPYQSTCSGLPTEERD